MTIGRHQFDTHFGIASHGDAAVCAPVAIVTAGAGGIGAATRRTLADQGFARSTPLGRFGDSDNIASGMTFLVSIQSGWTTAQTINGDGGLT